MGSCEQNTRTSRHARVHIEHTATENMWFLRKERKPLLKPLAVYYYYYGDISPVEKGEMFSSKYLTIVAKSRLIYNSTLSLVNVAKESRETLKRHDHEHKHQLYM